MGEDEVEGSVVVVLDPEGMVVIRTHDLVVIHNLFLLEIMSSLDLL